MQLAEVQRRKLCWREICWGKGVFPVSGHYVNYNIKNYSSHLLSTYWIFSWLILNPYSCTARHVLLFSFHRNGNRRKRRKGSWGRSRGTLRDSSLCICRGCVSLTRDTAAALRRVSQHRGRREHSEKGQGYAAKESRREETVKIVQLVKQKTKT